MTCRDLMTSNPSCCLPGDSAAVAAQIMKRESVGPVLVVSDFSEKRLVGIVTDRDLAMNVVAEGRDPHNTRVDEIMSANPITCLESDPLSEAVRTMAEEQVRRVPIVDQQGRLTGIIAQADVARHADEEQVGEMVEEISQPYGSEWSEGTIKERERGSTSSGMSALTVGAICVGVGAGLMFLFDPSRGRRRRAMLRDKAAHYAGSSAHVVKRTTDDLRNRATGAYAATRSRLSREEISDPQLVERIRSRMGRCLANPHAVEVRAHEGHVTLAGPVLAQEAQELVSCVRGIAGVQSVENLLEVHDWSERHPLLTRNAAGHSGWGPAMRLLSGAVGGGMMLYGLRSRSTMGKASASLGLGLLTRGIANREFGRLGEIANMRG